MRASPFRTAVEEISAGREPTLVLRAAQAASRLAQEAASTEPQTDAGGALSALDEPLDEFLSTACALISIGRGEVAVRGVSVALGVLANATVDDYGTSNPTLE